MDGFKKAGEKEKEGEGDNAMKQISSMTAPMAAMTGDDRRRTLMCRRLHLTQPRLDFVCDLRDIRSEGCSMRIGDISRLAPFTNGGDERASSRNGGF